MVFEFLKRSWTEVDQLHNVSARLEGLAEQHPPVSEALITSVVTPKPANGGRGKTGQREEAGLRGPHLSTRP
jgi:hypothetical protein